MSVDEVDSICNALQDRCFAEAKRLRGKHGWSSQWTTQAQVDNSAARDLEMIADPQIPTYRVSGEELAYTDPNASGKENTWRAGMMILSQAVGAIDGYASDARLSVVIESTVQATATQSVDLARKGVSATLTTVGSVIPWYVYAGAAAALVAVVVIYARTAHSVTGT